MSQPPYNPEFTGQTTASSGTYVPPEKGTSTGYNEPPPPYPGAGYPQQQTQQPYGTAYPAGYNQPAQPVAYPTNTTTTVIYQQQGNCPKCHSGSLIKETDGCCLCCIIMGVICLFPFGLLFLLCLGSAERHRCPSCGYTT